MPPTSTMKIISLILVVFAAPLVLPANPQNDNISFNSGVRQAATKLYRDGKIDEGKNYLTNNLRSDSGSDALALGTAQQLIVISWTFYGERKVALAQEVASEALALASPLLVKSQPDSRSADLFCNMGLLCEEVLFDLAGARSFYNRAIVLQPDNTIAKARLQRNLAKEKTRAQWAERH
jgi:hypothetical protein